MNDRITRRTLLAGAGGLLTAAAAAERFTAPENYRPVMNFSDELGMRMQRLILPDRPLAPEFGRGQITRVHPSNGGFGAPYIRPDPAYEAMLAEGFASWRLEVGGLVARPARFSLDALRSMPRRTQITMHCCDEGWSAIGEWTGVPLRWLLEHVGISQRARYIVFLCMDRFVTGQPLYSSIDMLDAFHPQTILAHRLNGQTLPKANGAPLRLRTELQIGYKNSKHINRIIAADRLDGFGEGRGGFWEDRGYQHYAGM